MSTNAPRVRTPQGTILAGFLFLLVVWSLWLFSQRSWWLTPLASEHGAAVDRVFYITLAITGVLFVMLQLLLAWLVIRFRHRGADTAQRPPRRAFENRFAFVAGVIILGVDISIFALGESEWFKAWGAAPDRTAIVEVTGSQFMWHFRYPGKDGVFGKTDPGLIAVDNAIGLDPEDPASKDDLISANELHVLEDQPVRLRLKSKDVIHSFFVPNFRVKQDLVPGMLIDIWFVPSEQGQFEIACNQLCGLLHHKMRGVVVVETREKLDTWLEGLAEQGE